MATLDSVMTKIRNLLQSLNNKTGRTDSTFNAAINALPSKVDRAQTTITAKANGTKDCITITASNPQAGGIVYSDTAKDTAEVSVVQYVDKNKVYAWVGDGDAPIEVEIAKSNRAAPIIEVSSEGVISASVTQEEGYTSGGTKSATKELATQDAKTITPATYAQIAVAKGKYTTGEVVVSAVPTEEKTVSPTTETQTVTPSSGKFLSKVTVNPASGGLSLNTYQVNIKSNIGNATVYYTAGDGKQYSKTITSTAQNIFVAAGTTLRVEGASGTICELSGASVGTQTNEENVACLYLPSVNLRPAQTLTLVAGAKYDGASIATCNVNIDVSNLNGDVVVFYTTSGFQLLSLVTMFEDFDDVSEDNIANYKRVDHFIAYDYIANPDGDIVPVLYKTDMESYPDEVDYGDVYYYVGTYTYDGNLYDRWRKIDYREDTFAWDSDAKCYVLTERVIENGVFNIPNGTIASKIVNTSVRVSPEIRLENVVCGSAIGIRTGAAAICYANVVWSNEYIHFITCHDSRETMQVTFH